MSEPITWYSRDKDGHTTYHTYYRMPGENWYGFSPPEPNPIGCCDICGDDVYTDEFELEGRLICPVCDEWYKNSEFFIEFLMNHPGSMATFLKDNCCEGWFEQMEEAGREYFEDDLIKYIKNEDTAPTNDALK